MGNGLKKDARRANTPPKSHVRRKSIVRIFKSIVNPLSTTKKKSIAVENTANLYFLPSLV